MIISVVSMADVGSVFRSVVRRSR